MVGRKPEAASMLDCPGVPSPAHAAGHHKTFTVRHVSISQLWGQAASPFASLPAFFESCRLSATASLLLFPNSVEKNTNVYS